MSSVQLTEFITLGQRLYVLMNPGHVDVVVTEISRFVESLESCALTRSLAAADPLLSISSVPYSRRSGNVGCVAATQLRSYLEPIHRTIYAEAGEQHAIAVNIGVVSQELRQLPNDLTLTSTQQDLVSETVTCIECGAYRSGVVMAWNLAYDFIRQWIYDNHLAEFNNDLTTFYVRRNGGPIFSAITDYDDFCSGKPDERTVIDTGCRASLFGERIRDNLRFYLRRRNNYAHPTFTSPSADQTNGYVKDLIDTIKAAPFA